MKRLASAIGLLAASPVWAQGAGHFTSNPRLVSRTEISADMGRCVLGRNRSKAEQLVRTSAGDPGYRRAFDRVRPDMVACLKGNLSMTLSVISVRGAIAESLVAEGGGTLLAEAAAAQPLAPVRVTVAGAAAAEAAIACAVGAEPAAAVTLLRADPATPQEAAAFRNLAPSLQACVPASGEVRLKPFDVRPLVAIAMYRKFGKTT